ncbi:MAG: hypothetical protein WB782_03800, partial [Thermoplasmata archaeon]
VEHASRFLVLGEGDAVVTEASVKEMIDALGALTAPAKTVIFDGVISQRLLDVAQEKGIATVVASRLGAVGKIPDQIRVYTRADLQAPSVAR